MSDLKEVSKKEFLSALYADKRDIMPTISRRIEDAEGYCIGYDVEWRTNDMRRELFGKDRDIFEGEERFWLAGAKADGKEGA